MSLTTDPSVLNVDDATLDTLVEPNNITELGNAVLSDGRIIESSYDALNNRFAAKAKTGANPTVIFVKYADFLLAHAGHALTHLGNIVLSDVAGGVADAWCCQADNTICFDSKT